MPDVRHRTRGIAERAACVRVCDSSRQSSCVSHACRVSLVSHRHSSLLPTSRRPAPARRRDIKSSGSFKLKRPRARQTHLGREITVYIEAETRKGGWGGVTLKGRHAARASPQLCGLSAARPGSTWALAHLGRWRRRSLAAWRARRRAARRAPVRKARVRFRVRV